MGNESSKPPVQDATDLSNQVIQNTGSIGYNLFEFVVTSIDVIETGDVEDTSSYGEGAKHVTFTGTIQAAKDDNDVVFLMRVREAEGSTDDEEKFEAIKVTREIFVEKIVAMDQKILACVHGFQTEPHTWLRQCGQIQTNSSFEHLVVPVIWPSVGDKFAASLRYDSEQEVSLQAGKAFGTITDIGEKVDVSLMCHSMGNRVLFSFAKNGGTGKLSSIFMVAADVWEQVFNTSVITDTWVQPPWNYWNLWKDTGLKLTNMLKEGGQIHVINYSKDRALSASIVENRRGRIGRKGLPKDRHIHKSLKEFLVRKDMAAHEEEIKKIDSSFRHSYHHSPPMAAYYNEVMNK